MSFGILLTMPTATSTVSERNCQADLARNLTKCYYQNDQQAKLMDLQAEIDSLLKQLQNLKDERLATTSQEK